MDSDGASERRLFRGWFINSEGCAWHPESITEGTAATLIAIRDACLPGSAYLARGTALALYFGHRRSLDLDFFAPSLFDEELVPQYFHALPGCHLVARSPHTIHATILETKVSFLGYVYPLLFPTTSFQGVPIADAGDIACMKISAVAGRGTKRDFIDLHAASRRFGLSYLLELFTSKFSTAVSIS